METFIPWSRSDKKGKPTCRDVHGSPDQSDDSIPSVVFPQSRRCRLADAARERRHALGFDKESYQVLNLYIFFTVVIQIVTAGCIISLGIVFIILNYRHGLLGELQVNLSLYLFEASGMLFLIGSYLSSLNHNFVRIPVIKHLKSSIVVLTFNMVCLAAVITWGLKTAIELKDKTFKKFYYLFSEFYRSAEAQSFLDDVQTKFECCGVIDKGDWKSLNTELPLSCCAKFSVDGSCTQWKEKGCYDIYYAKMYSFVHYIIGFGSVGLGIAIITSIPTIIAFCYAKRNTKLVGSFDRREETFRAINNTRNRSLEIINDDPSQFNNETRYVRTEDDFNTDGNELEGHSNTNHLRDPVT